MKTSKILDHLARNLPERLGIQGHFCYLWSCRLGPGNPQPINHIAFSLRTSFDRFILPPGGGRPQPDRNGFRLALGDASGAPPGQFDPSIWQDDVDAASPPESVIVPHVALRQRMPGNASYVVMAYPIFRYFWMRRKFGPVWSGFIVGFPVSVIFVAIQVTWCGDVEEGAPMATAELTRLIPSSAELDAAFRDARRHREPPVVPPIDTFSALEGATRRQIVADVPRLRRLYAGY